tara:strand:+ start:2410 stop:3045 length:636 start_codon:yes stop_codon:yes gene_type:complete
MKTLFTTLLLVLTLSLTAQTYSYFDNDVRFVGDEYGGSVTTLTHFGLFPITEKFGFTDYASIEGNNQYQYGQVLLGGYYNITDKLSVYVMGGKESTSNQVRFGYMAYYTTGDKFRTYAFYQRNQNPFSSETRDSDWYDVMLRVAITSKDNNSLYVGGRYMKFYGVGVPISVRQKLNDSSNLYLGYTTFYDVDGDYGNSDWLPTITLALEFL